MRHGVVRHPRDVGVICILEVLHYFRLATSNPLVLTALAKDHGAPKLLNFIIQNDDINPSPQYK